MHHSYGDHSRDQLVWYRRQHSQGEKLFARREPERQQATDDMYVQESARIAIPAFVARTLLGIP